MRPELTYVYFLYDCVCVPGRAQTALLGFDNRIAPSKMTIDVRDIWRLLYMHTYIQTDGRTRMHETIQRPVCATQQSKRFAMRVCVRAYPYAYVCTDSGSNFVGKKSKCEPCCEQKLANVNRECMSNVSAGARHNRDSPTSQSVFLSIKAC